jgi:hypothetical protein
VALYEIGLKLVLEFFLLLYEVHYVSDLVASVDKCETRSIAGAAPHGTVWPTPLPSAN